MSVVIDKYGTEIIVGSKTKYELTSTFPTVAQANVTRVNIPGWNFNVVAGKTYRVEIIASYQAAALTTGGSMGVVLNSGTGTIHGFMEGEILQTVSAGGLKTSIRAVSTSNTLAGSFMTTTGVGVIKSPHSWYGLFTFKCITSGVLQLQWGTEVANSLASLLSGSIVLVEEI